MTPGSRATQHSALRALAQLVRDDAEPESVPWASMRYEEVVALRARLMALDLAPDTANRYLSALRGVLRVAMLTGAMTAEDHGRAAAGCETIRGSREKAGHALDADEFQRVMEGVGGGLRGVRDRAMYALLFGGGLRRAEVCGLDVTAWNEREGSVRFIGKGNKERTVPLPHDAAEVVRAWLAVRGSGPGPLFGAIKRGVMSDRPLSPASLSKLVERVCVKVGVKFTPHDGRRTRITRLLKAGAPVADVQRLAGHANASTTLGYARTNDENAAREARRVGMG